MYRAALIIDKDGTLTDTEAVGKAGWIAAAREVGFDLSKASFDHLIGGDRAGVARGIGELLQTASPEGVDLQELLTPRLNGVRAELETGLGEVVDQAVSVIRQIKEAFVRAKLEGGEIPLLNGVEELRDLLARVPVDYQATGRALATNDIRSNADTFLRINGFASAFDIVIAREDITKAKPEPEIFLAAASKLGVASADCLILEDSLNGVKAGKAAEMQVVAIPNRHYTGDLAELHRLADHVFPSMRDALPFVEAFLRERAGLEEG